MVKEGNDVNDRFRERIINISLKFFHLLFSTLILCCSGPTSHKDSAILDPLEAGWQGQSVCELLEENEKIRVLKCTFPPGIGHEKHYHPPHIGYALAGGRFRIIDSSGSREIDVATGASFSNKDTITHKVVNIGETTAQFLIIEYR